VNVGVNYAPTWESPADCCVAVDTEEAEDYYRVIEHPMDIETMRTKVDAGEYSTAQQFVEDIQLILDNAKEYNPQTCRDSRGRAIVSAAHNMLDTVHSMLHRFKRNVGYDLFRRSVSTA